MERAFVTGAAGMVGSHLVESLMPSVEVLGTSFRPTVRLGEINPGVKLIPLDVCDWPGMQECIRSFRPSVIYHLAAQSLPTVSWKNPWETMTTNALGTINVFEAIRKIRESEDASYNPTVVVACSSAEYGASLTPERVPITEDAPLLPLHPYGVSKVAQDLLSFQYWQNFQIRCIRARIFNTTGPRKCADVVSDFAARVAKIKRSGGTLKVGNLNTKRAIMNVTDLIRALVLLAEKGESGEVYNICGEQAVTIGELIPLFEKVSGISLSIEQDQTLLRPQDEKVIFGSSAKLRQATGWTPTVMIEDTVRQVFDYEYKYAEQ